MKRRPPIKLDRAEAEEMSRRAEELDDLFEEAEKNEEPEPVYQSGERCPKHPAERLPCVFCRFAEQDRKDREREAKLRNAALRKAERKR